MLILSRQKKAQFWRACPLSRAGSQQEQTIKPVQQKKPQGICTAAMLLGILCAHCSPDLRPKTQDEQPTQQLDAHVHTYHASMVTQADMAGHELSCMSLSALFILDTRATCSHSHSSCPLNMGQRGRTRSLMYSCQLFHPASIAVRACKREFDHHTMNI